MSKDTKQTHFTSDPKQLLQSRACGALATAESVGGSLAGALKGAPPSNTAPLKDKYKTLSKIVHQGVDSLYLSFQGSLSQYWSNKLSQLKNIAQDSDPLIKATAQANIGGHYFEVSSRGRGKYLYVLKDNWFQIQVAGEDSKALPVVYVQISSELLTFNPLCDVIESIKFIVNTLASSVDKVSVSRVDICIDFMTDVNLSKFTEDNWVTRAKSFSRYSENSQFTGWSIGKGQLMARLYNKTTESKKSNKQFFYDVWSDNGWGYKDQVWRIEFQFKRETLNQLNAIMVEELEEKLSSLWCYATTQWLRLTLPSKQDTARTRWDNHPLWEMLTTVSWQTLPNRGLKRVIKERIPTDDYFFTSGFSVFPAYMAREGIHSIDEAAKHFFHHARLYHDQKRVVTGLFYHEYVKQRVAMKARKYNTIKNEHPDLVEENNKKVIRRQLT
ncbi:MAG: hypothetical protein L3J59_16375 [Methylococcaceae bacterium]|nr:hypothetical protein [Methylococcaceae bacterium]